MATTTIQVLQQEQQPLPKAKQPPAQAQIPTPTSTPAQSAAGRFRPFASSTHQVTKGRYITSNDPRGYIPVYEYPLNNQWIMMDIDDGYVLWTGIWKALGNSKADIVKMVDSQPELARVIRRVRGGYLKIQGTWMPFEVALRLARRVAWNIREDLVPLFGPTFPGTCLSPDQPGYGQVVASSGVRRRARRPQIALAAAPAPAPSAPSPTASRSSAHAQSPSLALSMPQLPMQMQMQMPMRLPLLPPHPQPHSWPGNIGTLNISTSARDWHRERERERGPPPPVSPSPFVTPPMPVFTPQYAKQARYAPYPPPSSSSSASASTSSRRLSGSSLSSLSPTLPPPTPKSVSHSHLPPISIHLPALAIQQRAAAMPPYALPPISALEDLRGGGGSVDDPRAVLKRLRGEDYMDVDDARSSSIGSKRSASPDDGERRAVKRAYSVPTLQVPPSFVPVSPVQRRSIGQLPLPPHPPPMGLAGRHSRGQPLRLSVPRTHSDASSSSSRAPSPSPVTPSDRQRPTLSLSMVPLEVLKANAKAHQQQQQHRQSRGSWPMGDDSVARVSVSACRLDVDAR